MAGEPTMRERMTRVEGRLDGMARDLDVLKADVSVLKADVSVLKADVKELKHDMIGVSRNCALSTIASTSWSSTLTTVFGDRPSS